MRYKQITIVDKLGDENLSVAPIHFTMTSYGADYTVTDLVRKLRNEDIFVPPFQRNFVWSKNQSSRFIESLLLGLPVPGIFLSKEYETEKLLIIDGQQRLKTLLFFYDGLFKEPGKEDIIFELSGVQDEYKGKIYKTLNERMRRRLDNAILHATIVKQDKPPEDDSSIYYLFERLNTGETSLEPQEIRACIYRGKFNELLKELNDYSAWRKLFGQYHNRMRDQELILRYFALYYEYPLYTEPMKGFMNDFMKKNIELKYRDRKRLISKFESATDIILEAIGEKAFKPRRALNAAVCDSVLVGVAKRLEKGSIEKPNSLRIRYERLMKDEEYVKSISATTGSFEKVRYRIETATRFFDGVK